MDPAHDKPDFSRTERPVAGGSGMIYLVLAALIVIASVAYWFSSGDGTQTPPAIPTIEAPAATGAPTLTPAPAN